MTGIVKRFSEVGGYGWIAPLIGRPHDTPEVFFHRSAILATRGQRPTGLPIGAEVRFILVRGEKGPQAANIELVPIPDRAVTREAHSS